MLSGGTDVVIRAGRAGEDPTVSTEKKLHGRHPRLACADQRQDRHLALFLLLPCDEIVDRLQAELLVGGRQVRIQHKQVPLAAG
jgi:hypothetical protein